MYIVEIDNKGVKTEIHNQREKLKRGNVVKGINAIDAFSFSVLPSNVGFDLLHEFTTMVTVYNTRRQRYEFYGRVLYANPSMSEEGLIVKEATCESYLGFLCDSQQRYVEERNWGVRELLEHAINAHNAQVEEYRRFKVGEVDVTDPNDNLYIGIQRQNTWDTLQEKLVDRLGGEFRFRVEADGLYLDYLTEIGTTSQTAIALSRNMKSITKEHDPTAYITRLIPLGAKLSDETEERLGIADVNGGVEYIDDEQAIELYGIHVGYKEWDDVTDAGNLLRKSREWLTANNKVLVKYSITALDLSALGLDYDDFDVCNKHPIQNALLGIDDVSRIIKKNIDVCEETKSTIEVGDTFKNLTDIQKEQKKKIAANSEYVSNLENSTNASNRAMGSRMSSAEGAIDGLGNRMSTAEINIDEANAQILLKASQLSVDDILVRMSYAGIDINGAASSVKLMAYQQTVDGIESRVSQAEIDIDGANSAITLKADKVTVDALETYIKNLMAGSVKASYLKSTVVSADTANVGSLFLNGSVVGHGSTEVVTGVSLSTTSARVEINGIYYTFLTGVSRSLSKETVYYLS